MGFVMMILLGAVLFYWFADIVIMLLVRIGALWFMIALAMFCQRGVSACVIESGLADRPWVAHGIASALLLILVCGVLRWTTGHAKSCEMSDGGAVALNAVRMSLVCLILALLIACFGAITTGQVILSSLLVQVLFAATFSSVDVCLPSYTGGVAKMIG